MLDIHTTYICVFYHFPSSLSLWFVVVVVAAVSIPMSMLNAVYAVSICSPVFFGCFGCVGYANSALICLRQSFVSRLAHISKPNQAAIVALTAHKFIPLLGGSTALKNKFLHLSLLFSIFQSEYDTHGTGVLPTIEPCTPLASTHTTTPTGIWQAKDLRPFLLSPIVLRMLDKAMCQVVQLDSVPRNNVHDSNTSNFLNATRQREPV